MIINHFHKKGFALGLVLNRGVRHLENGLFSETVVYCISLGREDGMYGRVFKRCHSFIAVCFGQLYLSVIRCSRQN